jgi:hypothetical protein
MVPDPSGVVEEDQDRGVFKLLQTDVRKPVKLEIANSKCQISFVQKYLKFPLTLPLSPNGEREEVRGLLNYYDIGVYLDFGIWCLEF